MRVLVVPKWYPWPDMPVLGSFCREQARAISAGHDVVVLASRAVRSPPFRAFALSDSVEDGLRTVRVLYRRPRFRPAAMAFQLAGMLSALRRLRREGWRAEIVHAHVYSAGLPALVLGARSRAPVVLSEHYTGFQRGLITGYDRLTARLAFGGAALVAPVSEDLASAIRALAPRAPITVVPNVVDTGVFHPRAGASASQAAASQTPVRLLTVAALAEKKGHAFLLDALARLRVGRPVTLDLAGDGELRDTLEARVRDLGLTESVRFHGVRPREEIAELMREADLFVLPSLFENLPCVLIEAMASGLPCVATAVGGVPELIAGPPHAGVLCPPGDAAALAAALAGALGSLDGFQREALAEHARAHFGYAAVGGRWSTIYEELHAGRRAREGSGERQ
ncbi:MAG: glycosyltransferase [Acidobacteriota bacterium]|nr:glycosyltransferase [Acidobacteriota bacterium]